MKKFAMRLFPILGAVLTSIAVAEASTASVLWLHDEPAPKSLRK